MEALDLQEENNNRESKVSLGHPKIGSLGSLNCLVLEGEHLPPGELSAVISITLILPGTEKGFGARQRSIC